MELHYVNQTYRGLLETYHNMNAKRDENRVPTALGLLSTDGVTITRLQRCGSCNGLLVSDGTTGSDLGNDIERDENRVPVLFAVSSVDGKTPVALYINGSGQLLIQST